MILRLSLSFLWCLLRVMIISSPFRSPLLYLRASTCLWLFLLMLVNRYLNCILRVLMERMISPLLINRYSDSIVYLLEEILLSMSVVSLITICNHRNCLRVVWQGELRISPFLLITLNSHGFWLFRIHSSQKQRYMFLITKISPTRTISLLKELTKFSEFQEIRDLGKMDSFWLKEIQRQNFKTDNYSITNH